MPAVRTGNDASDRPFATLPVVGDRTELPAPPWCIARMTSEIDTPANRLTWLDICMGVTVALVWGMGFVFSKAAIAHFPPILLMAFRFSVTALVLIWFVRPPMGHMRALFVISLISAALQYSLTFTGLKGLDAGVEYAMLRI